MRRLVEALHVIRLAQEEEERVALPTLAPLAEGLQTALERIAQSVRNGGALAGETIPPLRALHTRFADGPDGPRAGAIMLAELDELVDAVNTLGGLLGMPRPRSTESATGRPQVDSART